jgi:hypothetical protein
LVYAKPCSSVMLILRWPEAELVSSAQRASLPVSCYLSGRNSLPLHSACPLLAKLAGGSRACSPSENSQSEPGPLLHPVSAPIPWPWLMAVSAIDGAEALVLLTALRRKAVDQPGGWAFVAADAGSAAALITRIAHLRRLTTREDHQRRASCC